MSATDAIVIGEGWISEHYLTTDAKSQSFRAAVIARRKAWDAEKDEGSVRSRFSTSRTALLSLLSAVDDAPGNAGEIRSRLTSILGFDAIGLSSETAGPVTLLRQVSLPDGPAVALVAARPVGTVEALLAKDLETLSEPFDVDDKTQLASVARVLSHLFVAADGPEFALVLAGRVVLVAERERWPEGRYLGLDLQLICERSDDKRGGEIDTALTCISAESLAPDVEGNIWWHTALDESIKHTVGVSQDLREGVRLSIEIIANDVVARRERAGIEPLPQQDAQPLARQSLRFLCGPDAGTFAVNDTCPSCMQKDGIRFLGSAIATLLSVSLSTIFGRDELDKAEKKALVFTDSVQDAAHRAGFVQSRSHMGCRA